jgi:hypothetical protein
MAFFHHIWNVIRHHKVIGMTSNLYFQRIFFISIRDWAKRVAGISEIQARVIKGNSVFIGSLFVS